MHRGCISLGNQHCDECHGAISHGERYLIVNEPGESDVRLCTKCAEKRGYVSYKQEKGESVLTFTDISKQ